MAVIVDRKESSVVRRGAVGGLTGTHPAPLFHHVSTRTEIGTGVQNPRNG